MVGTVGSPCERPDFKAGLAGAQASAKRVLTIIIRVYGGRA
ncbi:hypothetical protein EBME_1862 [bacterium endosymbiont of Mortierella elongata FMR23-6]|nr:hypothetical protein EBME_1862 [bacterium endosymbiont of Mortierella elongata FMR23-6]